jgi:hypothetical protein
MGHCLKDPTFYVAPPIGQTMTRGGQIVDAIKLREPLRVLSREPHLDCSPTKGANVTRGRQSVNTCCARNLLARVRTHESPRWNVYAAAFLRGAYRLSV